MTCKTLKANNRLDLKVAPFHVQCNKVTLVVADGQGQERAHHATAIDDVAVEQEVGVRDLHLLIVGINVVNQGIHGLREVISGAHVHVGACGGLGGEVGRSCQVVVTGLGLHDVGHQHVLASCQPKHKHQNEMKHTKG